MRTALRRVLAGAALLAASACGPDATGSPPAGPVAAVVEAPVAVSAAVVRLEGVDSVAFHGGTLLTRRNGEALVAVFLLDVPGTLRFEVGLDGSGVSPSATLVEVADAHDAIVDDREGWRVRFGS